VLRGKLRGLDQVVERIFEIGVDESKFLELKRCLKFGKPASQMSYGELVDELDLGEDRAREAHELFINAEYALRAYEADSMPGDSDMREQALAALTSEKESGARKKQIAEADVEAKVSSLFPDEFRSRVHERAKLKGAVKHLEHLADLWKQRCRELQTMVSGAR
jgi:hypothetical protein